MNWNSCAPRKCLKTGLRWEDPVNEFVNETIPSPRKKQRKIVAHFSETPKNKNPGNAVFTVFPGFPKSSERGT